jgi:c-di-GMP-binding flagellar brake protein YcgR
MSVDPQNTPGPYHATFEDVAPRVGTRLQLIVPMLGRKDHFGSTLLGYAEPDYLIVRTPVDGGLAVRLANGEVLEVRLFTGVRVVEFGTTLLRQFGAPISYWHLAYPQSVRVVTLRAAPRARVELDAQAQCAGSPAVPVRLADLSAQGARVLATQPLGEPGGALELVFELPRGAGTAKIAVNATIRSVRSQAAAGETRYVHGVHFDNLSEHDQIVLQNFVLQKLNDEPAAGT